MTREMLETARSGNAFQEHDLLICRLDQLSRNEEIQAKLKQTDWDVIVCDEAHKMSASFFGGEVNEIEGIEEEIVDRASASRTIAELEAEIVILRRLEVLALEVRRRGTDKKWEELSGLLQGKSHAEAVNELFDAQGYRRKLIVFTEHRDTLTYLADRIRTLLGRPDAVVTIHGRMGRKDRRKAQEAFTQDKSDGTLRLIGLLWAMLEGTGPLLLEEPELSLHPEVVRLIPQMFARMQRRSGQQVVVSTHSTDLLRDD
jgi:superfamily II DNA or RNA helicase